VKKVRLEEKDRWRLAMLQSVMGVGAVEVGKLWREKGELREVMKMKKVELVAAGVAKAKASRIVERLEQESIEEFGERLRKMEVGAMTVYDKEYPERLKQIQNPPYVLFVRGGLEVADDRAVAMVGTRRPTSYGVRMAKRIAGELARMGVTVVSGLAMGIDAVAHRACMEAGGRTVAFLGNGIDVVQPRINEGLGKMVVKQGAVVSEYAPGTPALKQNFPARNRLVAGMSAGVIVVEGAEGSGSLITAEFGKQQGKAVMAIPGEFGNSQAAAPNGLIRAGARMVTSGGEVIEALGWESEMRTKEVKRGVVPKEGKRVYERLRGVRMSVDELSRELQVGVAEVMNGVTILELGEWVEKDGQGRYGRVE